MLYHDLTGQHVTGANTGVAGVPVI